jgi:hypothetical protein
MIMPLLYVTKFSIYDKTVFSCMITAAAVKIFIKDWQTDPKCGQAVWQHRKKAEEKHFKTGQIPQQVIH